MKTETRILILFIIALMCLMGILFSCSEEVEPKCYLHFYALSDNNQVAKAQTYSKHTPDTHLEIWAAGPQDNKYPIPGMFLKITSNELDSGTSWGPRWREIYHLKGSQDYKYVWFQMRVVSPCGESDFVTYLTRVGFGLQEQ